MDTILNANSILDERSWLFFKLYKDPSSPNDWKSNLDWYHQTLFDVVKPVVSDTAGIRVVLFGFYGPMTYNVEDEAYEQQIATPTTDVVYIRLRISVKTGSKNRVKGAFITSVNANTNLIWNYEIMRTYHVMNDLGSRYGSNTSAQTLQFIRYWDAACRYILSILNPNSNWVRDVDVWGVPHLVNNSLGAWLRPERSPRPCSQCNTHMYMRTFVDSISPAVQTPILPLFQFICPNCGHQESQIINI